MGEKVFVVMEGYYSARSIEAVYSEDQEASANEYARLIGGDVESYPLNRPVPEDPGMDYFHVEMKHNGSAEVQEDDRLAYSGERHESSAWLRTVKDEGWRRKSYWRLKWNGYALSPEHARRAANELRRQILAGQRPPGVDMGKN